MVITWCDSNYMTFWKRPNYRDSTNISGFQGLVGGRTNRQSTEDLYSSETTLYNTTMVGTCHYTFVQTHRIRVNPNVYYGLWVIMMCQCRFINYNKCTTLVRDVDNGGVYACGGSGSICEISVPSAQFCCEPKTGLKKIFLKNPHNIKF